MNKNIVLGVTGGIAAYKAVALCSLLSKQGYNVHVIMTESATKFVTPLTFQTITRNLVYTDTFDERDPKVVSHIDLADLADLVVLAPATANIIGKIAHGIADDMLSTVLLATTAPVVLAPAMNVHMYTHPAVQENLRKLKIWGYEVIEPNEGPLACGYVGKGRLAEPDQIYSWIEAYFNGERSDIRTPNPETLMDRLQINQIPQDLSGKTVLITAGPTQEPLDPVRFITNRSSGKMGYALAQVCLNRGAKVHLVTGPTYLTPPQGAEIHAVKTAEDMAEKVLALLPQVDWVIATAAVADYRPKIVHTQKIKKKDEVMKIELVKNPDVLKLVGENKQSHQTIIGFAAETEKVLENAWEKLERKNLDFIVVNDVSKPDIGFDQDKNEVVILDKNGNQYALAKMDKVHIANHIIDTVLRSQGDGK